MGSPVEGGRAGSGAGSPPGELHPSGTLLASARRHWAADPGAPVLVDAVSGLVLDGAAVEELTGALASRLIETGLAPGAGVLWSPARPLESALQALAVLRAGLVLVAVNPTLTPPELRHVLAEVHPAASAADDPALQETVRQLDTAVRIVDPPPSLAEGGPRSGRSGRSASGGELDAAVATDPALILFTSGTTGKPKAAAHSHASLLANAESLRLAWRWEPGDRLVHVLPMFHAHGLCVGLLGTLHAGASAVLLPRFGPSEVFEAIEASGATLLFGVPTMYHRLHASGRSSGLSRLRLAVSGSAPLPASLHTALAKEAGVIVLERYGTTEALMSLSNPYEGERRPGSVGLPLPGVEIRLEPVNDGGSGKQGDGGTGELLVRSGSVFSGYVNRASETAEVLEHGWYRTGDVVSVAEDGYVRVLGRTKELVISGGYNVYPAEVETALAEHPGVAEIAVSGTPSAEWGEVVTAYVVPAGESDGLAEALGAFAAERLAPYKRPRIVHLVGSLPRNALGKIVRERLNPGD